jgi:capsular polysaccharide biosynthesis protein
MCLAAALLPLLTFAYSSAIPDTYSATVRIAVSTGGPDSLIESTAITGPQLDPDLAVLRSFRVAEDAVQRLSGPLPPDRTSFVKASAALRRQVKVGLGPNAGTLEVTARASSPGRAAVIANAFADGLLQVRGAQAQNLARTAVAEGLEATARLPRNSPARRAAIAALRQRLVPVLAERQIQVVQPAEPATHRLSTMGVTAAIALLAILAVLMLTGVWRPRPSHA